MSISSTAIVPNHWHGAKPLAVTVKTARKLLGVGNTTVWSLIKAGRIQTARNVGDALALLRTVPPASIKLSSWDPQYRQLLTKLAYGNEGMNRGQRRKQLSAVSPAYIASCDAEIGRIMAPSGYCCRRVDVTSCPCHVRGGTTVGSARLNCWPTLQTRREASASLPARVAHRPRPARSRAFPPTGPPKRKNARTARCGPCTRHVRSKGIMP
jgi:hypothetical protein